MVVREMSSLDELQMPFKLGKYYNRDNFKLKSQEIVRIIKRGHRLRKFGLESVVVSFRVPKELYIRDKKHIREKINNTNFHNYQQNV